MPLLPMGTTRLERGYAMTIELPVQYLIYDCHGLPQCGCDVIECQLWCEVEEYFEDEEALERLHDGYARIEEVA